MSFCGPLALRHKKGWTVAIYDIFGDDFMVKVVDFNNPDDREFVLQGHKAPVLSVSFDPLDIFIASSSCDGTIRVWRVDQRKEVKCIRALSPCSDPTLAISCCRLCWQSISGQVN
ncbi:Chromosome transmission fidelity protein 4 [Fasciola gigantica]|uniref:Chromosome transmission fidelity protein 4 n=1 Tax=Fasciola gigantica TaxID=46835 RepID=A0A504YQI1_FASGI|nr:Chromosome transmission fidelity protein 4 [Fasciola gigantica]